MLHSTRVSVPHCRHSLSSSSIEDGISPLPLEHVVYDEQNRQIYQQSYEHWPSLSLAHGIDDRIGHALWSALFLLSCNITGSAYTASLQAEIPAFLPLGTVIHPVILMGGHVRRGSYCSLPWQELYPSGHRHPTRQGRVDTAYLAHN